MGVPAGHGVKPHHIRLGKLIKRAGAGAGGSPGRGLLEQRL